MFGCHDLTVKNFVTMRREKASFRITDPNKHASKTTDSGRLPPISLAGVPHRPVLYQIE